MQVMWERKKIGEREKQHEYRLCRIKAVCG